jgi:hypothetical protein
MSAVAKCSRPKPDETSAGKADGGRRAVRREGRTRKAPTGERICSTQYNEFRPQSATREGDESRKYAESIPLIVSARVLLE